METIRSSADISLVFNQGSRWGRGACKLIVLRTGGEHDHNGRVAFVAGKKLGKAVWRNRAKRRMRAACQALSGPWPGYDVIFLATRATTTLPYEKLLDGYRRLIKQAKIHS